MKYQTLPWLVTAEVTRVTRSGVAGSRYSFSWPGALVSLLSPSLLLSKASNLATGSHLSATCPPASGTGSNLSKAVSSSSRITPSEDLWLHWLHLMWVKTECWMDSEPSLLPLSGPGAGAGGRHRGVYLGDVLHAGQRSSGSCHQSFTCHTLEARAASGDQVRGVRLTWEFRWITSVSFEILVRLPLINDECDAAV